MKRLLPLLLLTGCLEAPTLTSMDATADVSDTSDASEMSDASQDASEDLAELRDDDIVLPARVLWMTKGVPLEVVVETRIGDAVAGERCEIELEPGSDAILTISGLTLTETKEQGAAFLKVRCDEGAFEERIYVATRSEHWLDAGTRHTCVARPDGRLRCWGLNDRGQLGFIGPVLGSPPNTVEQGRMFQSVATGSKHTCALTRDGEPLCFGSNIHGQLGNGATGGDPELPTVADTDATFAVLSSGGSHTCGVTTRGKLHCTGNNERGQLGFEDLESRSKFERVNDRTYVTVGAGFSHTCALTMQGVVECAGAGEDGALGNNSAATMIPDRPRFEPINLRDVVAVELEVGRRSACAKDAMGTWYCWGWNDNRRFPSIDANTVLTPAPAIYFEPDMGTERMGLGLSHACASRGNEIFCKGSNRFAQAWAGRAHTLDGVSRIDRIVAGGTHNCLLVTLEGSEAEEIRCFGDDTWGQCAVGGGIDTSIGISVLGNVQEVYVSERTTCARLNNRSQIECWGDGFSYQKGNGTQGVPFDPIQERVREQGLMLENVERVCAGQTFFLGLNREKVSGWGLGEVFLQETSHASAQDIDGLEKAKVLACGWDHACTITDMNRVECIGSDADGQFGRTPTEGRGDRLLLPSFLDVSSVYAGRGATCVQTTDLQCAGKASTLGLTEKMNDNFVSVFAGVVEDVAIGDGFLCLIDDQKQIQCQGRNDLGQIPGEEEGLVSSLTTVELSGIMGFGDPIAIRAGRAHVCVRGSADHLVCWGDNSLGALRGQDFVSGVTPFLRAEQPLRSVSLGEDTTCWVDEVGETYCLGRNTFGQSRPDAKGVVVEPVRVAL